MEIKARDDAASDAPASPARPTAAAASSFNSNDSFAKQWRDAQALAGCEHDHLSLQATLSPTDAHAVDLIVSFSNICESGVSNKYSISTDHSYPPEEGVRLEAGTTASEYRILLRDDRGNAVPPTGFARRWLAGREIPRVRPLRPGESIGFVFPLDAMFAVEGGGDYTAMVVLPGTTPSHKVWVAPPVKFHVPEAETPGVNRPPFGSPTFRERMLPLAGDPGADFKLESALRSGDDWAKLEIALRRQTNRAIPFWERWGHDRGWNFSPILLIVDSQGTPVRPKPESPLHRSCELSLLQEPGKDGTLRDSGVTTWCTLSLAYPLRPGGSYSVLAAANVTGTVNALTVAKPKTFVWPFSGSPSEAAISTSGTQANAAGASVQRSSAVADDGWQQRARFAGKPFEGLLLEARVAAQTVRRDSSPRLALTLRNCGDRWITLHKWKGESDYEIIIRDRTGNAVAATGKGKKFFGNSRVLQSLTLEPGGAMNASLPLAELFEIRSPGEYTVLASLPVIGDVDAVLTAAPLKVRITPEPAAPKN